MNSIVIRPAATILRAVRSIRPLGAALAAACVLALLSTPRAAFSQEGKVKTEPDKPKTPETSDKKPAASQPVRPTKVRMKTNVGEILIQLDWEKAPISAENFAKYAGDGFYDGTVIHRVVPGFVIQGGGYDKSFNQKSTRAPIKNEWKNGLKNERGTLSMARTANPDSATSQFFVNLKHNESLDQPISGGAGYAVFGKVIEGMEVVDKIAAMQTQPNPRAGGMPSPVPDVVIEKATAE